MRFIYKILDIILLCMVFAVVHAQRTYKPHSVLAAGNWYKLAVSGPGIYKMDLPFLNSLGITGSISSSQVRLYGNSGTILPEAADQSRIDDLNEISIEVIDGGDGILNGSDFILFYSPGPDIWEKDSVNKRFIHKKNIYSDQVFYYLTIGGTGQRIQFQLPFASASTTVTSYDERFFHELDSVNFLASGKEWYGEEFSGNPGKSLSRSFSIPFNDIIAGSQASIYTNVVGRSVNNSSRFNLGLNGVQLASIDVPSTGTGSLDLFAQQVSKAVSFSFPANSSSVNFSFVPGGFNAQGWLNWFEVFVRGNLAAQPENALFFRDWNSVGNPTAEFIIGSADNNYRVWDVTDPFHVVKMNSTIVANQLHFINDALYLHEYVCFPPVFLSPIVIGRIPNQDLHSSPESDFIIVAYPDYSLQAQRLAQFHKQRNNLNTVVVTTDQVFNEFSGGIPDPSAIRDFVKMFYDRYRSEWNLSGKYLLLFGKGSFDYKNRLVNNTNFVPAYQSVNSLDPLSTYTSDDYFGFIDDHDDINSGLITNLLQIGIGRIPAKNRDEAKNFVDKIIDYHSASSLGPWRNNLNFVADDGDYDLHLQDAETLTSTVSGNAPDFNIQKVYLDAFKKEGGSGGGIYPQANATINNNIYNGTLMWNFSGHGGPTRLAEEDVIDQQIVNSWNNQFKLPLFITATCDFAPFDNPLINSLGENLIVRPKTGAIALMTTTRVVFAYSNKIINNNYLQQAFQPDSNGKYKSLGQSILSAKNATYQNSPDIINNRKFTLLGDPAMTLAFPEYKVIATALNGKNIITVSDTLRSAELVTIDGEVHNHNGGLFSDFQGTVNITLFDKPHNLTTLGNDPASIPVSFSDQENSLFRGKATVKDGRFSVRFRMPKDINYQFGKGKLSIYVQNGSIDGNGLSTNIIIGGVAVSENSDKLGPDIKAFLNDEKFVNGGITNPDPVLILLLSDSSGINTGNTGVGHDIVATIDNDNHQYFILNNFYESDQDNYQKGKVRFQLPSLSPGHHSIKIKAWDVLNNSSEYVLEFTIVNTSQLQISHVLNYPNPFTTNTSFWFEHNYPNTDLYVKLEIFTINGKLINTLTQTINTIGNRSSDIHWDGRDEYGNKIGRGVYIYRLRVKAFNGKTAEKWEKLVILN